MILVASISRIVNHDRLSMPSPPQSAALTHVLALSSTGRIHKLG